MATFITDEKEIDRLAVQAREESDIWREDYHEYERLADNDILPDLDESLPEVNDGTLAAALFKLPKRVVNNNLKGRAISLDRDESWITELANIQWENEIIPNANSQAPFIRKWKDAVRKAAIYGSVPLVTIFVERNNYVGTDFLVVQPQDVTLEPGKVSDYDSDILFWDVYFTRIQVENLIERAKAENKEAKENEGDGYNKWNVAALQKVLKVKEEEEQRDPRHEPNQSHEKGTYKKGYKFCVVFQRGVGAPFYMYHKGTKETVREWSNPDPTGDVPIHFLYCYQDFVNPYGTGIVKLAGGTQNVLDTMRQYDVLATALGLRPPISVKNADSNTDLDSLVYAQDAQWMVGGAEVKREEISNQVYQSLPERIQTYQSSLNKLIPMGDTSVSAGAGDPLQSKTPAGVKLQAASLSIDDEDFKQNLHETYEAVAASMINVKFANMQGTDLMKLSDEQRDVLAQAGLEFPVDEEGNPTNELEVIWDEARSTFKFEMDAEQDKTKDEEKRLEGLLRVAEFRAQDPNFDMVLAQSGKRFNIGELYSDIIALTSDNEKIIEDITPEDEEQMMAEQQMAEEAMMQEQAMAEEQMMQEEQAMAQAEAPQEPSPVQLIMEQFGVDEQTANFILASEQQGFSPQEIQASVYRNTGQLIEIPEVQNG